MDNKLVKYGSATVAVILVIVGIVMFTGESDMEAYQRGLQYQTEMNARLSEQEKSVAQAIKNLPFKLDNGTTVENIVRQGNGLKFYYILDIRKGDLDLERFAETSMKNSLANSCEDASKAEIIKYGARYDYFFMSRDNLPLGEISIGKEECGFE